MRAHTHAVLVRLPFRASIHFLRRFLFPALTLLCLVVPYELRADMWRVGIAQTGIEDRLSKNLAKILLFIRKAAAQKCRLVVFPERSLSELPEIGHSETRKAVEAIRQAAAEHRIYVMLGAWSRPAGSSRGYNWMVVLDPEGREIFRYDKLYDRRDAELPRLFYIDGIPCNAVICADRWLRAVAELPIIEGAKIFFELSNNFRSEWVPALEWYWYVPRALRNNAYVVFANTAVAPPKETDKHGHSAIVDPQGNLVAAARDDREQMLIADLDLPLATREEAERRRNHPAFREFWEAARRVRDGEPLNVPPWRRYESPVVEVKIAAAQMAISRDRGRNVSRMEQMIGEAAARKADVIVFPELAVTGTDKKDILAAKPEDLAKALRRMRSAAKNHGAYVIFGMPSVEEVRDGIHRSYRCGNSAYVISPNGEVLTRYDQMAVDRRDLFEPGACPTRMWFRVKGVPAIVSLGRDALWSEISEMAAFAGAQLLFNLAYEPEAGPEMGLRRLQVMANFASFLTFAAAVNAAGGAGLGISGSGGTTIWDDLRGIDESRAAVRRTPPPESGEVAVFASFAANCVVQADKREQIVYATRKVNQQNPFRQDTFNTRMKPWYSLGARIITGCFDNAGPAATPK